MIQLRMRYGCTSKILILYADLNSPHRNYQPSSTTRSFACTKRKLEDFSGARWTHLHNHLPTSQASGKRGSSSLQLPSTRTGLKTHKVLPDVYENSTSALLCMRRLSYSPNGS